MRPARGRGSRGGADVLTLPWGSVVPRHSAMHDRCIRAAPCLSKRNKLSEPRWAFERQDPAGHMFFWRPRRSVDATIPRRTMVADGSRADCARESRTRTSRARVAGAVCWSGRKHGSRAHIASQVASAGPGRALAGCGSLVGMAPSPSRWPQGALFSSPASPSPLPLPPQGYFHAQGFFLGAGGRLVGPEGHCHR